MPKKNWPGWCLKKRHRPQLRGQSTRRACVLYSKLRPSPHASAAYHSMFFYLYKSSHSPPLLPSHPPPSAPWIWSPTRILELVENLSSL